ncbi:MAG TPA: hypothetical protein VFZ37_02760 [Jiangellaceae bacterium]
MPQARMTSNGRITVPKVVRDELNLTAGSKVMFVKVWPQEYRIVARTRKIDELLGIVHRPDVPALTIEEINEGIAEAAAEGGIR